jgi:hypothetical protein
MRESRGTERWVRRENQREMERERKRENVNERGGGRKRT